MVPVFSFLVSLCVRRDIRPTKLQRDDFFFRYFCFAPVFLPTVRPFLRFDVLTLCIFCCPRIASFGPEAGMVGKNGTIFCNPLIDRLIAKSLHLKQKKTGRKDTLFGCFSGKIRRRIGRNCTSCRPNSQFLAVRCLLFVRHIPTF